MDFLNGGNFFSFVERFRLMKHFFFFYLILTWCVLKCGLKEKNLQSSSSLKLFRQTESVSRNALAEFLYKSFVLFCEIMNTEKGVFLGGREKEERNQGALPQA